MVVRFAPVTLVVEQAWRDVTQLSSDAGHKFTIVYNYLPYFANPRTLPLPPDQEPQSVDVNHGDEGVWLG